MMLSKELQRKIHVLGERLEIAALVMVLKEQRGQRGNQMCHCLMMITRTSKEKHIHYHTHRPAHTQGLIM